MVILAIAVSEAVQVVGVLLIFALIVAPAAIAERFTTRPSRGVLLSAVLAVLFTWAGLTVAYYFPYPVGFFITTIAFWSYILARVLSGVVARRAAARPRPWREEQVRHSP
jgi:zinc/manganese transport system permease protein